MAKILLLLFVLSMFLVSGCSSETGRMTEKTSLTAQEDPSQNLTPEDIEELHREFEEFEKSQAEQNKTENTSETPENASVSADSGGGGQPVQMTRKCPPCDDSDPCTTDYCSKQTVYECVYEAIIPCCGNGACENSENWSTCPEDCECNITCGPCELTDNTTCSCANVTQCITDGCCPAGCNHTTDSDCPNSNLCEEDSDCDDSDPCTIDACSGSPKKCSSTHVTECFPDDGCCPESCAYPEDSDCPKPSAVFSEIYYNPEGSDPDHEWIEIYNNGEVPIDVTKLKFEESGVQHKITSADEAMLNPDSYSVIAENSTQFLDDYPGYLGLVFDSSFSLSNSGEELILRAERDGETMDSVSYNSTWGGNGFSLEKIDPSGPNTQENWNQSLSEKGTPGRKNSITA
jgi:hypothetical protein